MLETKICTKCGIEKPITEFNWRSKKDGTRRSECKECHSLFMKNKYQQKREIVGEIKSKLSCQKCGYNLYPVALDFHHIDPTQKDATVARMLANNYELNRTLQEIDKCICLCAKRTKYYFRRIFIFLILGTRIKVGTHGFDP